MIDLSEKAEEILETLWIYIEEKNNDYVSVNDLRVNDYQSALNELIELGYITVNDEQVRLASKGMEEARDTVRRHRLAERLFVDVLDIKGDLMNDSACKMEHLLHKGVDESICTLLGHPKVCPHGKPIPPGNCCKESERTGDRIVAPLSDLEPGEEGTIAYIHAPEPETMRKLIAMGMLPTTPVRLIRKFPSFVFQLGYTQFAVDEDIAKAIYVRLTNH